MNSEYANRFRADIAELETDVYDLPLHQIERLVGLGIGVLSRIERACDPERGSVYDDDDFAEYEGKRSLKLWTLTETYLYNYSTPTDPLAFITKKFCNKITAPLDVEYAKIVIDLFNLLHENKITSYDRFALNPID